MIADGVSGNRRRGVVGAFDAAAGLGTIETEDGAALAFHCVAIADGTRTIEVGVPVSFTLVPKFGRYEASDIRPDHIRADRG